MEMRPQLAIWRRTSSRIRYGSLTLLQSLDIYSELEIPRKSDRHNSQELSLCAHAGQTWVLTNMNHRILQLIVKYQIPDTIVLKLTSGVLEATMHMPYGHIEKSNLLTPEAAC